MTREEFVVKHADRLLEALPAGTGVRPVDLTTNPPTVEAVPHSPEAEAAIRAFDWSEKGRQEWEDRKYPERTALRKSLVAATTSNNAFLAIRQPTPLETATHLKTLTENQNLILKFLSRVE